MIKNYSTNPMRRDHLKHFIQMLDNNHKKMEGDIEISPHIILSTDFQLLLTEGNFIPLPGKEFELLMFFVKNRYRFVSIQHILLTIWDEYTTPENARQYIYKLRCKLRSEKHPSDIIIYKKGMGYMLLDNKTQGIMSHLANYQSRVQS